MRIVHSLIFFALATVCLADTLTLKSGRTVSGTYLGGTARQIRMEVGDKIETFDVGDVASLQFAAVAVAPAAAPASAPAAPASSPAPSERSSSAAPQSGILRPEPQPAPAAAAPQPGSVLLPTGTAFTVRMIDAVDSQKNNVGDTFAASMDEPVMVDGKTVIPRGADVVVKLVDDKESGKLTGRAELALSLMSVKLNGRSVDINTQTVTQVSDSRGGKTAKMATGGAALGAIIGAIAGGGKGAAIGAGAGAGAGAGVQVLTKGQRVHIPSETLLTFTLNNDVRI